LTWKTRRRLDRKSGDQVAWVPCACPAAADGEDEGEDEETRITVSKLVSLPDDFAGLSTAVVLGVFLLLVAAATVVR
jgi:hypothetical protein